MQFLLPTNPNCCTQSNSHCHLKLSQITQVPSNATSYRKPSLVTPEKGTESYWVLSSHLAKPWEEAYMTLGILQCRENISLPWCTTELITQYLLNWHLLLEYVSGFTMEDYNKKPRKPRSKGWCSFVDVHTEAKRNLQLLKVIRTAVMTANLHLIPLPHWTTLIPNPRKGVLQEREISTARWHKRSLITYHTGRLQMDNDL